jgi:DNA-binding transcriptional ArsR family regulator
LSTPEATVLDQPGVTELDVIEVLAALADPVRLQIVRTLAQDGGERPCGSFGLPVGKSTSTHHFRVLREAGVITQRRVGTMRLTRLRGQELEERFPGLLRAVLAPQD